MAHIYVIEATRIKTQDKHVVNGRKFDTKAEAKNYAEGLNRVSTTFSYRARPTEAKNVENLAG